MVSLVCSAAYPTTSISILLTGYDTPTKKENYRHPQHTRETVHSYSEQSNSKHLTSVVVSRFASIPSGPRAVAPFSERESAPLLGVLCLSQRSCAVGFLFALAVAVFFFLWDFTVHGFSSLGYLQICSISLREFFLKRS